MNNQTILVLDFGGHHRELIASQIRSQNVYSIIKPGSVSTGEIREINPVGIVLTAEPQNDSGDVNREHDVFKLGIPVFIPNYQDGVRSEKWNAAFHEFLFEKCGCSADYSIDEFIETTIEEIRTQVGNQRVLLALSGGVDSSVCAALIAKAVPNQLTCVFVDHGLMRKNEGDEIEAAFSNREINFVRVNAQKRFLDALAGVSDPERKRKIIGETFIRVFEEASEAQGQIPFLGQGTIYPDILESGTGSKGVIKSHHNVGGLPKDVNFVGLVEPLKGLFKDEVRVLGRKLGLPAELVERQPFPGPGLGVRCVGEVTEEKLDVLREADAIVREEIGKLDEKPNQYFAVLPGVRSVGVVNDERATDYVIAVRAVRTKDFMTAEYMPLPHEVLGRISERISREVKGAGRVVYDISGKPPATIEWE